MMVRRIQRFEVLDQLGSGGMGHVYRARDPELERDVAIKVLASATPPHELSSHDTLDLRRDAPASRDDLLQEARMMARLSHPNVLPVYEVGLADGAVFLVMEHIDGKDLSAWLARPRTTEAILGVFLQAARGLAAAHERGIVHRDVKPENILIGSDGRVRLADFGLSKLTARPASAMIRDDDGRGTPRYMAPELWRGEPATPRADVYALCLTLTEALAGDDAGSRDRALRERRVRPHLRQVLERGLVDDPADRPPLAALIAALEDRPPRWRAWPLAGAAAAAIVVGAFPASPPASTSTAPCAPAARDRPERLASVRQMLLEQAQPSFRDVAQRLASDIATQHQANQQAMAGACKAMRDRDITWDQYKARTSCLRRRSVELAATIDLLIETRPNLLKARDRIETVAGPSFCNAITAPPIAGDPAAAEALWRRYAHSAIYLPRRNAEHIAELTAIADAAATIGEAELHVRATRWIGIIQRYLGEHQRADETLQRAYRLALDLKAISLTTQLLIDRSSAANVRDDVRAAVSYAELARDAGDSTAEPHTRARIYLQLGRAYSLQGDDKRGLEHLRHALEILQTMHAPPSSLDLDVRDSLLAASSRLEVPAPGMIKLAHESAELIREQLGDRDQSYGSALFVLATTLASAEDYTGAIRARRQAIEIVSAKLEPNHPIIPQMHATLAYDLYLGGDLEAARREIDQLAIPDATYEHDRWQVLGFFALVAFELGQLDDGLARAIHAQDESIAAHGLRHRNTLDLRRWITGMLLELGRLDDAARQIAAIEDAYRANPDPNQLRLVRLRGTLAAELAIARGEPGDAEAAARHALRVGDELQATERDRARFHATLGASLVAQRRWAEACTALQAALALLTKVDARRDDIAGVEIELAIAEANHGDRAGGVARARRARAVLDGYPGRLRARAAADTLLGKAKPRRPQPAE